MDLRFIAVLGQYLSIYDQGSYERKFQQLRTLAVSIKCVSIQIEVTVDICYSVTVAMIGK